MDTLTKAARSALMSKIRSKHTGPERRLAAALRNLAVDHFTMHDGSLPGKPDFLFDMGADGRLAVEVMGCFFHGCPRHYKRPKTNRKFWDKKVRDNMARDRRNGRRLRRLGVGIMRVWEHRLRTGYAAETVAAAIKRRLCAGS